MNCKTRLCEDYRDGNGDLLAQGLLEISLFRLRDGRISTPPRHA